MRLANWALDMDKKANSIGASFTKQNISAPKDREAKMQEIIHALCLRVTELSGQVKTSI